MSIGTMYVVTYTENGPVCYRRLLTSVCVVKFYSRFYGFEVSIFAWIWLYMCFGEYHEF